MSLPVPSAYSAQILLTLWLALLLVAAVGYGLARWWHARTRRHAKAQVKHRARADRPAKRAGRTNKSQSAKRVRKEKAP